MAPYTALDWPGRELTGRCPLRLPTCAAASQEAAGESRKSAVCSVSRSAVAAARIGAGQQENFLRSSIVIRHSLSQPKFILAEASLTRSVCTVPVHAYHLPVSKT
jgi:hypothetical protein